MNHRITMRQIEALRAAVLTGGASAAVWLLNFSQPSVSRLLADLEREVGFPLFDRSTRRLRPTPECEVLYAEAERLFSGLSGIAVRASEIRQSGLGQLRVACMPSLSSGVLPKVVADFLRRRPEVQITLSSLGSATVVDWVTRGLVDLGIALKPLESPSVESQPLISTELVCALPAGHPPAADQRPARLYRLRPGGGRRGGGGGGALYRPCLQGSGGGDAALPAAHSIVLFPVLSGRAAALRGGAGIPCRGAGLSGPHRAGRLILARAAPI